MTKPRPKRFLTLQGIAEKQDGKCAYCGVAMLTDWRDCHADWGWKHPWRMTWDHVVPKSAGGSDDPSNAAAACLRCNVAKRSMSADAFSASIRDGRAAFERMTP